MLPELREEVVQWLSKARNDLYGAGVLTSVEPPAPGIACYLCQQAAEKALKAFLTWRQTPFRRTHDLEYVLDLCLEIDADFVRLREATKVLNPYAGEFRYPGRTPDPPRSRAREALELAHEALRFVLERLPEDLRT